MKNNYIVVHGSFSSPYENWFLWLNQFLINQQKNVLIPAFPSGIGYQTYENWKKILECYQNMGFMNETTTLIAHSIGPIFLCKYLIEHQIHVKKLIFVSGFNNVSVSKEYDEVNQTMFYDCYKEIVKYCSEIICFYSDNDPYLKESVISFAQDIATTKIVLKNAGHINKESNYITFPEIIEYL